MVILLGEMKKVKNAQTFFLIIKKSHGKKNTKTLTH
jgi:hypothetical protein